MIQFQEQLIPQPTIEWASQEIEPIIVWYNGEQRIARSVEERKGSSGLRNIHPVSIFTVETYLWDQVEW